METVYNQTAGVLCGGTADEVVGHIERSWERGQAIVDEVRRELGEDADRLAPLNNGGVNLLKVRGLMHDTCNTANTTSRKLAETIRRKARLYFRDEAWNAMPEKEKCVIDRLCSNHTRNLPIDAWNRKFEEYLKGELGDKFKEAGASQSRLEMSGKSLSLSICKLIHGGYGAYAKGDGKAFVDSFRAAGDEFSRVAVGRVQLSHRQDWILAVCQKLFPLISVILVFTDETRRLDANILRDSVFIRLQLLHFQVFFHVGAVEVEVAFEELRALTNSTGVAMDPTEINEIYEYLWKHGTLLIGDSCLDVFDLDYRPWPKVDKLEESLQFYSKREKDGSMSQKRWERLRDFRDRSDAEAYTPILKEVLGLFGKGIHESLSRTMGDFLEATNGTQSSSKLDAWVRERCRGMVATNNNAGPRRKHQKQKRRRGRQLRSRRGQH